MWYTTTKRICCLPAKARSGIIKSQPNQYMVIKVRTSENDCSNQISMNYKTDAPMEWKIKF